MDAQIVRLTSAPSALEIDLIVDLVCPWSYLARRQLNLALGSLQGTPVRALRWHGLPAETGLPAASRAWRGYLAARLPRRADPADAERELQEAGRKLGIAFAFDRIGAMPDTSEAHRLIALAAGDAHQPQLIDALFAAHFEQGRDIADPAVLESVARECGVEPAVVESFGGSAAGRDAVQSESRRLRGLGVESVPNVLLNGHVLVPGPADVDTYVQALEQTLFPELAAAGSDPRRLH